MAVFQGTFMAQTLNRTVPFVVILPTDKAVPPGMPQRDPGKPYKTLYLLHGIIGSCIDWLYGTRIQRWAEERELAVVMPSGDNSMYLDHAVDRYGAFVGQELVEFTRRTFPLSHRREDTFIGGLSMGGFGAMRNGLVLDEDILTPPENPQFQSESQEFLHAVYGPDLRAALVSDRNPKYLVETMAAAGDKFPDIYMACGEDDFLLQKNLAFHELLDRCGVPHTFELGPGAHEWDFWDTYIKKALDWLPLEDPLAGRSSGNVR